MSKRFSPNCVQFDWNWKINFPNTFTKWTIACFPCVRKSKAISDCPARDHGLYPRAQARVAQLDRVSPSEGEGHRFESCRERQKTIPCYSVRLKMLESFTAFRNQEGQAFLSERFGAAGACRTKSNSADRANAFAAQTLPRPTGRILETDQARHALASFRAHQQPTFAAASVSYPCRFSPRPHRC